MSQITFAPVETSQVTAFVHGRFGSNTVRALTDEPGLHYDSQLDGEPRASFYKTPDGFELWTDLEAREPQKTAPSLDGLFASS